MWAFIIGGAVLILLLAILGQTVFVTVIENAHTFFWLSIGFIILYVLIAIIIGRLNPVHLGPANVSSFFHAVPTTSSR